MATRILRQGHSITTPAKALESLEYPAAHVRDKAVGTIRVRNMLDRDARTASQIRLDTLLDVLAMLTGEGHFGSVDTFQDWREGIRQAINACARKRL